MMGCCYWNMRRAHVSGKGSCKAAIISCLCAKQMGVPLLRLMLTTKINCKV